MDRPETRQALLLETAPGSPDGESGAGPPNGEATEHRPGPGSLSQYEASVVLSAAGAMPGGRYGMFEVLAVSPEGATLAGGLLLEVSEEVTFELRLPDRSLFRARARVIEILHGRPPAMKIVWTGVAESERRRLDR